MEFGDISATGIDAMSVRASLRGKPRKDNSRLRKSKGGRTTT